MDRESNAEPRMGQQLLDQLEQRGALDGIDAALRDVDAGITPTAGAPANEAVERVREAAVAK